LITLDLSRNDISKDRLNSIANALKRSKEKQEQIEKIWCLISICISFVRANHGNIFAFSILSLVHLLAPFGITE